jgi:uncharacterized repeat protein (TIGR03803 family)
MRFVRTVLSICGCGWLLAACTAAGGVRSLPGMAVSPAQTGLVVRESILYSFRAGSDGSDPLSTLIADTSGALFGTTDFGGSGSGCFGGCGTVFKLTPSHGNYVESVLYSFGGGTDGHGPAAGVISGPGGVLYGTTEYGGDTAGNGIVFKLTPSGSKYVESVLYRFKGGNDGNGPLAGLTMDAAGNLFGATLLGGGSPACGTTGSGNVGCGTIFELKPSGSGYSEHILHSFQSGSDGATPGSPPIIVGRVLYGTAATGGGKASCGGAPINPGCGTIYKLTRARGGYKFSTIYAFSGTPNDAANPFAGLVRDNIGNFYGIGQYGGAQNQGAVFELKPGPTESVLHSFSGGNDGSYPLGSLALAATGALYGTTQYGGSSRNAGIAFELTAARVERVLFRFQQPAQGEYPVGGLLIHGKGVLIGTTSYGGTASAAAGTVFKLGLSR